MCEMLFFQYVVLLAVLSFQVNCLPSSAPETHSINATAASPLFRRQCYWVPDSTGGGKWVCDNKFVPLSTMVTKIRDVSNHGGAGPDTHVYFYSNLRKPTDQENPRKEPAHQIHQQWIEGWWVSKSVTNVYSVFDGVDVNWLRQQVINARTTAMDKSDLDQIDTWPSLANPTPSEITQWCYMQALAAAAINPDAYFFTTKGERWKDSSFWALLEYWKLVQNPKIQRVWRVDPTPGACDNGEIMWQRGQGAPVGQEPLARGWMCPVKEPSSATTSSTTSSVAPTPKH